MKITNIQIVESDENNVFSADIDEFHLWYKFPKIILPELRADAFVAACLIPSMKLGTDIVIDDDIPVSTTLIENLEKLQVIFSSWSKLLGHTLTVIQIKGGKRTKVASGWDKTISFFSGGVDGTYTYLKHAKEIDYLLFAKGIDMQLSSDDLYNQALSNNREYLAREGKEIIPFETNVRFLGHEYDVGWSVSIGGGLSSIALAAGAKKCYIASTYTCASMHPAGSNFITDHLWGNGFTEIVHDGDESTRINKLQSISKDSDVLNILRVCWHDKGYNCGNCEKCLRTMAAIRSLKLDVPTFPTFTDELVKTKLAKIKIYDAHEIDFIDENLEQAIKVHDRVLVKALTNIRRNYDLRKLMNLADRLLFLNFFKRLKARLSKA
ncbi:MAG: hypothetical protein ACPG52_10335 [Cognaticolwellia sp.]